MTSFWTPKNKPRATKILKEKYPVRTTKENKLIQKHPYKDSDNDKVMNYFDCKPLVKKQQDMMANIKSTAQAAAQSAAKYVAPVVQVPKQIIVETGKEFVQTAKPVIKETKEYLQKEYHDFKSMIKPQPAPPKIPLPPRPIPKPIYPDRPVPKPPIPKPPYPPWQRPVPPRPRPLPLPPPRERPRPEPLPLPKPGERPKVIPLKRKVY